MIGEETTPAETFKNIDDIIAELPHFEITTTKNLPLTENKIWSPKEVRPIPKPALPLTARKRRIQKSEILTSTPVKEDQKCKYYKTKQKFQIEMKCDKPSKILKKINKPKDSKDTPVYVCFYCGEDYFEINGKPIDDWIQCNGCSQWMHEKCSAYEGAGIFICENCGNV